MGAISAVFDSWKNQRAITYRKLNDIPEDGDCSKYSGNGFWKYGR